MTGYQQLKQCRSIIRNAYSGKILNLYIDLRGMDTDRADAKVRTCIVHIKNEESRKRCHERTHDFLLFGGCALCYIF